MFMELTVKFKSGNYEKGRGIILYSIEFSESGQQQFQDLILNVFAGIFSTRFSLKQGLSCTSNLTVVKLVLLRES